MRFMYLVSTAPESAGPPPPRVMEEAGKMAADATAKGAMLSSGGLMSIAGATRARVKAGKLTITDGPFTESKEVLGGFAIFEFATREEAVESMRAYMELYAK